jgi:hypothetical protein
MAGGDQYRRRAEACFRAAKRAKDPDRRFDLTATAERWIRLAETVDTIDLTRTVENLAWPVQV